MPRSNEVEESAEESEETVHLDLTEQEASICIHGVEKMLKEEPKGSEFRKLYSNLIAKIVREI
jgi:hypothetical protein